MYKLRLIFGLTLSLLLTGPVYAQIFVPYTAQEGVSAVLEEAAGSGMTSPELMAITTADFSTDAGGIPISSIFDFDNGEATVWLYVVRDADNPGSLSQYLASQVPFLGFSVFNAADFDVPIPGEFFENLSQPMDPNWLNSDGVAQRLRANISVQQFLLVNPGLKPTVLGVWKDALLENATIWNVYIGEFSGSFEIPENQPGMICQVNAINGETECLDDPISTSVDENAVENATLAPNPAEDFVTVYLAPGVELKAEQIVVRDISGRSIYTERLRGGNSFIPVEISRLAQGVYTVQVLDAAGRVLAHSMLARR